MGTSIPAERTVRFVRLTLRRLNNVVISDLQPRDSNPLRSTFPYTSVPYQSVNAFVLARESSGESMLRLHLFTRESGPLVAYRRRRPSRTAGATVTPDLFDRIEAVLETRNEGRTWFVKEDTVSRRFPGIGRAYETLDYTSRFARLVSRNPCPEEAAPRLFRDVETAFSAWEAGGPPALVFLKALYLYARDEGFPVRQDWLQGLPAARRASATALIRQPLAELPGAARGQAETLADSLQAWLRDHHELRF